MKKGDKLPMTRSVKVAVCGHLPTACDYLLETGLVNMEFFTDATQLQSEADYNLILVYAPQGEGLLNTRYSCKASEILFSPAYTCHHRQDYTLPFLPVLLHHFSPQIHL